MFYVYVLRSRKTGRRYVGSCNDIADRFRRHNAGHNKATQHGVPWELLHTEPFPTRSEAVLRERYDKTGAAAMNWTARLVSVVAAASNSIDGCEVMW